MSAHGDGPVRRRRLRVVPPAPDAPETPESILPGTPRVGALDALLREVDGLRLSLETDLSLAASAVESGHPQLASEILDSDREGLRTFERRALGHLQDLAAPEPVRTRRVRIPVSPFVAAAAVVGFALALAPQLQSPAPETLNSTTVSASDSLDTLQDAAAVGDTLAVRASARELHAQLMAIVAVADTDPAAAQQALLLLSYERSAIVSSGDSTLLHDVLVQSTALANRIRASLPAAVRSAVPRVPAVVVPVPTRTTPASPKPSSSPASKPSAKPSPTPRPTTSPAASPKPSPTSSRDGAVLPTGNPVGSG